jgi:hypothetical protein
MANIKFITRGLGLSGMLSGEAVTLFCGGLLLGVAHVRMIEVLEKGY